jgi:hypothetical protein
MNKNCRRSIGKPTGGAIFQSTAMTGTQEGANRPRESTAEMVVLDEVGMRNKQKVHAIFLVGS